MATQQPKRVARLRQALEKNETAKLYAPRARNHKIWHVAPKAAALDVGDLFPNFKIKVEDAFEAGDKVVVRWRMRGTHSGKVKGIKPTGYKVDFTGINIYRYSGDKIVESWGEFDAPALAQSCRELGGEVFEYLARGSTIR